MSEATTKAITPIVMPKWGLEMREGTVSAWLVEEGARIGVGQPIIDVETDKISNAVEAPDPGLLRRRMAKDGETLPVKALLGVLAEADVSDADIDAYVAAYELPAADAADDEAEAFAWVTVDGIHLRYARRDGVSGGRTPVLFVHGFGGDLGNWLFNLDAIAEVAPVIALDLPGHGQSDPRLPGATLDDMAGFIAHFMDAIDVPRAHLVGHSMGGAIGAQLAAKQPERVASLVLVNSAGLGREINAAYIDGFVGAASRRELKPVVEQLFADPSLVTRQLVDELLKYKRLDGVPELLQALSSELFAGGNQSAQPARDLDTARVPVVVVWGEADRVIPAEHAKQAPGGAKVKVLPGAGHMSMMEKASDFNAIVKGHLAEY